MERCFLALSAAFGRTRPLRTALAPAAVMQEEGSTIPVATFTGIQRMTQQEYEIYIQLMKNLPVMSKAYIFGHTIPQPQTDQSGYIHLSAASPPNSADIAVPQKDETLVPVATSAGILPMKLQEYEMHVRSMGYLPMSKAHVLGHTILQSKTDKLGHIHPSVAPRVATTDVGQPK